MQVADHTITREPEHPGYDTLGDTDNWGEDYYLLVDGNRIGGTYWCPVGRNVAAGEQWASYGPAGLQIGFRTREEAEQAQLEAAGFTTTDTVTTEAGAEPQPEPTQVISADAYDKALTEARERGAWKCSNPALMASICDGPLQTLVGAVAPQFVWEGAQKKGMTAKELLLLCHRDPMAVEALMWI